MSPRLILFFVLLLPALPPVYAAIERDADSFTYTDNHLRLHLSPRQPQQIAAFYEGRGFPKSAIDSLTGYCFLTVGMRNTGSEILWLDLSQWHFSTEQGALRYYYLDYWQQQWQTLGLAPNYRSTFHWTVLPERIDLQPDEPVGGNIILPYTEQPIRLEAHFPRGSKRELDKISLIIDDIRCGKER